MLGSCQSEPGIFPEDIFYCWANMGKYGILQITAGSKKPAKIRGEKGEQLWNGKII